MHRRLNGGWTVTLVKHPGYRTFLRLIDEKGAIRLSRDYEWYQEDMATQHFDAIAELGTAEKPKEEAA